MPGGVGRGRQGVVVHALRARALRGGGRSRVLRARPPGDLRVDVRRDGRVHVPGGSLLGNRCTALRIVRGGQNERPRGIHLHAH